MKKLTADLYLIEEGSYAERRGAEWFISDEQSEVTGGPFGSLDELERSLRPAEPDPDDLVTLTEGAKFLPISPQALYQAQKRGALKVEPAVRGRSTTLYSLRALKEAYDR